MNKTDKNIFAEVIDSLTFEIAQSNRPSMINCIIEYSGEEYENINLIIELAKKTDEQLRYTIRDIITYYVQDKLFN
jgi:hypothetical protein